ncbi:VTT domain-containing protein [Halorubellus sp. JP-L1]|uniref:TVP38/TMEM64 family protein n=1 Tax=Halorubellus sp. JP-L1 TaxID=2715753 RepID=UPI0014099091|nr:VTT domain-containing protein [Halorubellus sp. JP-L1]NHN42724.1 VTT domain-containing protein [Halorubellus sp. JP-L1]
MASVKRRLVPAIVVVVLVVLAIVLRPAVVVDAFSAVLDSPWFPVVLLAAYLGRSLVAWPITPLAALVGFKYGLVVGVPVALAGAAISTFVPYAAVRYFDFDGGVLGWAADESDSFFHATGDLRGMVAARVAPVPAEATSLAAGAAHVKPTTFLAGTVLGELPWAVAAVLIGHSMHRLALSEVEYSPWLLAGTAAAALLLLTGPTFKFVRGRQNAS